MDTTNRAMYIEYLKEVFAPSNIEEYARAPGFVNYYFRCARLDVSGFVTVDHRGCAPPHCRIAVMNGTSYPLPPSPSIELIGSDTNNTLYYSHKNVLRTPLYIIMGFLLYPKDGMDIIRTGVPLHEDEHAAFSRYLSRDMIRMYYSTIQDVFVDNPSLDCDRAAYKIQRWWRKERYSANGAVTHKYVDEALEDIRQYMIGC
jgi:hypothetical protein